MELFYKKCKKEDINLIYENTKHNILRYEDPTMAEIEDVLKLVRTKIEGNYESYVSICCNETKVGYYHLLEQTDLTCLLDDLFVLKQYRNQGIGTKVMHDILQEMPDTIYVYVYLKNVRLIRFLEKNGFYMKKLVSKSRAVFQRDSE